MRRALVVLLAAAIAALWACVAVPASAATQTIVTIGFDDTNLDQYTAARPILQSHGMHATFFVNSGFADTADHMTWSQIADLAADGNEIGGHTIDHANLKHLKEAAARHEVCDDRAAIASHGLQPTSFAYPFGGFDAGTEAVVAACGYNSGRGVSGVNDRKVFAETVPPLDAYATRTPPNPKSSTTLATMEGYVTAAEQNGGGWVQFVFHHVCDHCDAYSITPADLQGLLDFLAPRAANGTVVRTTQEVIGGPFQPPVPA
ncbi:MAG TPA: polysaccharide deacetylase family protein [Actinomycetes bacterium]